MFSRQRKARVLFALSDIALVAAGFEAAYRTRAILNLEREFFLAVENTLNISMGPNHRAAADAGLALVFPFPGHCPGTAQHEP